MIFSRLKGFVLISKHSTFFRYTIIILLQYLLYRSVCGVGWISLEVYVGWGVSV